MAAPLYALSFDEASGNFLDYSGNGRDVTLTGALTRVAGRTLNGASQTSAAADSAGPSLTGLQTAEFTVMAWVKRSSNSVDGWLCEIKDAGSGDRGILFLSGNVQIRARNSGGTVSNVSTAQPTVGTWYHVAGSYSTSDAKVHLYINGSEIGTGTALTGPLKTTSTSSSLFDTLGTETVVDDVRYFGSALTASEITTWMNTPVSIANTWTSSTTLTAAATSVSIDITAAPVGDWVYCFAAIGANQTGVTMTGWTVVLEGDESTSTHYALLRRKKQSGDTTFTLSWPTSSKGTFGLAAWTGLDPTTPDELAQVQLHTTGTSYPTPSVTPGGSGRYAATFTYSRTSTTANKAIAFTPDAALAERLDFNNSAAASAPWTGQEIADSSSPVTVAAHSYTAVQAFSESHGGAILLYLVPPQVGTTGTVAATEQNDTPAASGTFTPPAVSGSAAVTQANQTASASGVLGYSGTLARTQANQTSTASGVLGYSGTVARTEANDTVSASGTFTASGFAGSVAATQASQTSTASGVLGYAGTVNVAQAGNVAAASGQLGYMGTLTRTQANQTSTATGVVANAITGSVAVLQQNQFATATGTNQPLVLFGTSSGGVGIVPSSQPGNGSVPHSTPATFSTPSVSPATGGVPTSTGA